ncbi:hypothetical protein HDV00_006786 [Rhizophlyctis rosea]|nr:hypothetical protein HDV00_006786 [Rhizophlyctis rosea]
MSFGGSAVKSLEIVPDASCKGENGTFVVEGGWGVERKLLGNIDLIMKKAAKEARLSIVLKGFCKHIQKGQQSEAAIGLNGTTPFQTEIKKLIQIDRVIFDARESGETRTLNTEAKNFKFPFTIDLPTEGLPPTYNDGTVQVYYTLRATLQWSSMGRQTKEWDARVEMVMPKEARRKLLAEQRPVTVTNNEQVIDENASLRSSKEDFKYEIHVQRRVLNPLDPIPCQIRLMDMPTDVRNRISRVTAHLKCTRRYILAKNSKSDVATYSNVTELIGVGHPNDFTNQEWQRAMVLNVPEKLEASLDTPLLTIKYVVNFSIYTEMGGQKPLTAIEVPVVVVPAGEAVEINPNALPTLVAFDTGNSSTNGSIKDEFVGSSIAGVSVNGGSVINGSIAGMSITPSEAVDGNPIGRAITGKAAPGPGPQEGVMYRAITSYDGNLPDELRMREGDLITVKETYDDGWGMGKNMSTGNIGFVYLDYLTIVNLTENGRRPPPRAQSEYTSRSAYQGHPAATSQQVAPAVAAPQPVNAAPASPYMAPQPINNSPYMSNHYQSSPNLAGPHVTVSQPPSHHMNAAAYGTVYGAPYGASPYDPYGQQFQPNMQQNGYGVVPGMQMPQGPPSPGQGMMIPRRTDTVNSNTSGASPIGTSPMSSPDMLGQATGGGSTYVCISPFAPTRADQLPMELGDIIVIRKLLGDGWAWGTNAARAYSGLLPMSSVTPARGATTPAAAATPFGAYGNGKLQMQFPAVPQRSNTVPASPPLSALPQLPPPFQNQPGQIPTDPAQWEDQQVPQRTNTPDGHKRNPSTKSIKNSPYNALGGKVVHSGLKMSPPPEPGVPGTATAQLEATMAKLARLASLSATDNGTSPTNGATPVVEMPLPTPPLSTANSPAPAPPTPTAELAADTTLALANDNPAHAVRKRDTRPPPYEEHQDTNEDDDTSSSAPSQIPAIPPPARRAGSLGTGQAPPTLPRDKAAKPKGSGVGMNGVLMYRVVYDFTPTLPDELEATKGDIILVRETYEDDWALGKNLSRNKEGVFPLALTEVIEA